MKKFFEIIEEVKNAGEAIKAAEARLEELSIGYMKLADKLERNEARKAAEAEINETGRRIDDLNITREILKSNAKIALFNEAMPVALGVLSKYAGKQYGEKTRQKISDEVREKTGCRFYIGSSFSSQSYMLYQAELGNTYNIEVGTEYRGGSKKPLLIDNKIQAVNFDEVALYYVSRDYVEDIPGRIEELRRLYKEAVAKQNELKTICSRFNALSVGDLPRIYEDRHIFNRMFE